MGPYSLTLFFLIFIQNYETVIPFGSRGKVDGTHPKMCSGVLQLFGFKKNKIGSDLLNLIH